MAFQFKLHGLAAGLTSAAVASAGFAFQAPKAQAQELDFQCYDVVTKELILAATRDLTSNALFCVEGSMGDLSLDQDFGQPDEPVVIYASNNDGGSDFMEGMLGAALGTVIGNVINGPSGGYQPGAPDPVDPGVQPVDPGQGNGNGGGNVGANPGGGADPGGVADPGNGGGGAAPGNGGGGGRVGQFVCQQHPALCGGRPALEDIRNPRLPRPNIIGGRLTPPGLPDFNEMEFNPLGGRGHAPRPGVRLPNLRPNLGAIRKPQLKLPRRPVQTVRPNLRPNLGAIRKPQLKLPRRPVQTARPNVRPNFGAIRKPQLKMPRPALKPGIIRTGTKRLSAPRIKPSLRTKSPLLRRMAR